MINELADRLRRAAPLPSRELTVAQLTRGTQRYRQRQAVAGATLGLLVIAGALIGLLTSGGSSSDRDSIAAVSSAPPPVGRSVSATPSTGLLDGQTVIVRGSGFAPDAHIAMVTCGAESEKLANKQDACAIAQVQYASADARGNVSTSYVVQRTIETAKLGKIDCGSAPNRCRLGVGELQTQKGASVLLSFSTQAVAATHPLLTLDVVHGLHSPLSPEVSGSGFVANRSVVIRQCLAKADCGTFPVLRSVMTNGSGSFTTGLKVQQIVHLVTGDDVWCGLHCKLVASQEPDNYGVVASTAEFSLASLIPTAKECELAKLAPSFAGWTQLANGDRSLAISLTNKGPADCSLTGYPSLQATKTGRVVSGQRLTGIWSQIAILNPGGAAQFQATVTDCGTDQTAFDSLTISLFGGQTQRTVSVPVQPARTATGFCAEGGTQILETGPFAQQPG
jgi:hypothetical protein